MQTSTRHLKLVALFFATLIFFQGCTVYKSLPISIEQAIQNESKVKVITKNDNKLKFKRIINVDGKLYGVRNLEGTDRNLSLDRNSIETIKEKDIALSVVLTVLIPIAVIAVLAVSTLACKTC